MTGAKEPLMHIVKRDGVSLGRAMLVRLVALVFALLVCAAIIFGLTGMNPLNVYAGIWDGAVGTNRRMWVTFRDAAILLCVGFAVLPAFRMRFWNVGAEGQVLVGAMASAAIMIYGKNLPSWAMYALCPVAGVAAGLIWGVIPAFFKAHWNTNETLFTLMLNYIAMQLVSFAIVFWENPRGSNHVGLINSQGKEGWLPSIGTNSYLLPILIVLALMVGLYVYMQFSKQGYERAKIQRITRASTLAASSSAPWPSPAVSADWQGTCWPRAWGIRSPRASQAAADLRPSWWHGWANSIPLRCCWWRFSWCLWKRAPFRLPRSSTSMKTPAISSPA